MEQEQADVFENQLLAVELPPNLRAALDTKEKEQASPEHMCSDCVEGVRVYQTVLPRFGGLKTLSRL